jgi:hypothetical protein
MAKLNRDKERPLRPVATGGYPCRLTKTAGTLPWNGLALHFGRSVFHLSPRMVPTTALTVIAPLGHDHR